MSHMLDVRRRRRWRDITPGVGWVNFFGWEPVPYLSENVCQIWLRSDGRVEKGWGGGVQTDRQTDRQRDTAALYSRGFTLQCSIQLHTHFSDMYKLCCKILEHVIALTTMKHSDSNSILSPFQHGFGRNRSCETQLLQFTTDIANILAADIHSDRLLQGLR